MAHLIKVLIGPTRVRIERASALELTQTDLVSLAQRVIDVQQATTKGHDIVISTDVHELTTRDNKE